VRVTTSTCTVATSSWSRRCCHGPGEGVDYYPHTKK